MSGLYRFYAKRLEKEVVNGDRPNHIAIVLDGNRRWAKRNLVMQKQGHFKGADTVENLLDWCEEFDIKIITLYVLSAENLDRKNEELDYIYDLIKTRLEKLYNDPRIHKNEMRVKGIGRIELLPDSIKDVLSRLDNATKDYSNHFLNIAIAYGGQQEIVDAVKKIAKRVKNNELDIEDITEETISKHLYTANLPHPNPDLIIRTSGEERISNFLTWQSSYSELYFCETYWPLFRKIDFLRAIRDYQRRERRFGKISEQLKVNNG